MKTKGEKSSFRRVSPGVYGLREATGSGGSVSGTNSGEHATSTMTLSTEMKRSQSKGITPRFVRHERGFYGLSRWMGKGLFYEIERHNQRIRKRLLGRIRKLPPAEFEALIGRLLTALNFEKFAVTKETGDGGVALEVESYDTLIIAKILGTRSMSCTKCCG